MSDHAKHFEQHRDGAMRLAPLSVTRFQLRHHRNNLTAIGFVAVQSYAMVFRCIIGRHHTSLGNLSRLPRLRLKKSGRRKPNKDAASRLPRLAPTVFSMYPQENGVPRRVLCAGREFYSRCKNALMKRNHATYPPPVKRYSLGLSLAGTKRRGMPPDCAAQNLVN